MFKFDQVYGGREDPCGKNIKSEGGFEYFEGDLEW